MEDKVMELAASMAANDKEHESFRRRLNGAETDIKHLSDLTLAVQETATAVKSLATAVSDVKTSVDGLDERIGAIEKEPADKWRKISFEIIKAVVLAAAGVIIGYFI